MRFSISGIFKPTKQPKPVSNVAPKIDEIRATDTKTSGVKNTVKEEGNGGSCCGQCGGSNH